MHVDKEVNTDNPRGRGFLGRRTQTASRFGPPPDVEVIDVDANSDEGEVAGLGVFHVVERQPSSHLIFL